MTRLIRQRFWLIMMDLAFYLPAWLGGGFGSCAYHWALERASNATDWGCDSDCGGGPGEEPF